MFTNITLKCQHGSDRVSSYIQALSCYVQMFFSVVMYDVGVCCYLNVKYIVHKHKHSVHIGPSKPM